MQAIKTLVHALKRKMSPLIFPSCPVGNHHPTPSEKGTKHPHNIKDVHGYIYHNKEDE